MMNARKAFLLLICLVPALMLTACYTDADPWPVSDGNGQAPAATDTATATPAPAQDAPQDTAQPIDTAQPDDATTTEDPGLNG